MSGIIGKREVRGSGVINREVTYTQAEITALGTIASGTWEGTDVAVAHGGTGASAHTANNVLLGAGTGAITSAAPSTSGYVLTSNGTVWASAAIPAQFSLGSWTAKSFDTNYQATTDEWVTGWMFTSSGLCQGIIFSDSSSTPTTIRTRQAGANGKYQNMSCIIKSGDYWRFSEEDGSGVTLFSITLN